MTHFLNVPPDTVTLSSMQPIKNRITMEIVQGDDKAVFDVCFSGSGKRVVGIRLQTRLLLTDEGWWFDEKDWRRPLLAALIAAGRAAQMGNSEM